MEVDTRVKVYNEALGVKGNRGKLLRINELGYYEVALELKDNAHQVLLPISSTVLLSIEPIVTVETVSEMQRY